MKLIAPALILFSGLIYADVDITQPLMTLTDSSGKVIEGISRSTSAVEAMEKATKLPNGTYMLQRPDATITVSTESNVSITRPSMVLTDLKGNPVDVSKSRSAVEAMQKASFLPDGTYILKRPTATIVVKGKSIIIDDELPIDQSPEIPSDGIVDPANPIDDIPDPNNTPIPTTSAVICPNEVTKSFSKTDWFVCSIKTEGLASLSPYGTDYPMSYMIPKWGFTNKQIRVFLHPDEGGRGSYATGPSSFRFSLDLVEIHPVEQKYNGQSGGWWMYSGTPKLNYNGNQIAASVDYIVDLYKDKVSLEKGLQLVGTSLGGAGVIGQSMILPKYQSRISSVSSNYGYMIMPKTNPKAISSWTEAQLASVDIRKQWQKVQHIHYKWTGGENDTFNMFDPEFMDICEQRKISCRVTWLQSGHGASESGYSIPMWSDNSVALNKILPVLTNNTSNYIGEKRGYYNIGIKWDLPNVIETETEIKIPLTYTANKSMGVGVPDQPDVVSFSITPRHIKLFNIEGTVQWTFGEQSGSVSKGADNLITIDGLSLNDTQSKTLIIGNIPPVVIVPEDPIVVIPDTANLTASIVYTRVPRTLGSRNVVRKGIEMIVENIDIWDTLPEVSRRSGGFNAPGQLIIRQADGTEKIIYDCFKTARPCVPIDPSVSLDGKKIAFAVHSVDAIKEMTYVWGAGTLEMSKLSGKNGEAEIYIYDIATESLTKWPHVKGNYDGSPVWLPEGKMMFASRRAGHYRPWIQGLTPGIGGKEYRLFIANQDGSNQVDVSPHEMSAAAHPYLKADGRVAYSSLWLTHNLAFNSTNGGVNWFGTTENMWILNDTDRNGGDMTSLLGAHKFGMKSKWGTTKNLKALHFIGQRKNNDVCVANYYRANNLGLGDVWCFTPEAKGVEGKAGTFNPRNLYQAALWSKSNDEGPFPESRFGVGDKGSKLLGKIGWPEGAPDGQLILTKGTGWCTSVASSMPGTPNWLKSKGYIGCNTGLYKTTKIPSEHPDDLELIVDEPEWHEYGARVITARVIKTPPLLLTGNDTCVLASSDAGTHETHPARAYNFNNNYKTAGESGQEIAGIDHNELAAIRFWAVEPNKSSKRPLGLKNSIGHKVKYLGEAPLLADKSFAAEIPCETPYIMAGVDKDGLVIKRDQIPQSLRKGEKRVCMGCHLHSKEGRPYEDSLAFTAIPTKVNLFEDVPLYNKDIKPILEAKCASCHAVDKSNPLPLYDYNRLVWDYSQKYVPTESRLKVREHSQDYRAYGLQRPYTSKYVNTMFARESLLYWKVANKRMDSRTDDSYSNDVDFGAMHETNITKAELALIGGWLDSGAGE